MEAMAAARAGLAAAAAGVGEEVEVAAAAAAAAALADTAAPRRAAAIRGTPTGHHSRTRRVAACGTARIGGPSGGSSPTAYRRACRSCSTAATGSNPRKRRSRWALVVRATERAAAAAGVAAGATRSNRLRGHTRRTPASRMCTGCTIWSTTVVAVAAMRQSDRQRIHRSQPLRRAGWSTRIGRRWRWLAAMRAAAHAPRPYARACPSPQCAVSAAGGALQRTSAIIDLASVTTRLYYTLDSTLARHESRTATGGVGGR